MSNKLTTELALHYAVKAEAKGFWVAAKIYFDTALRLENPVKRDGNREALLNSMAQSDLIHVMEWWPEDVEITKEEKLSKWKRKVKRLKQIDEEELAA